MHIDKYTIYPQIIYIDDVRHIIHNFKNILRTLVTNVTIKYNEPYFVVTYNEGILPSIVLINIEYTYTLNIIKSKKKSTNKKCIIL